MSEKTKTTLRRGERLTEIHDQVGKMVEHANDSVLPEELHWNADISPPEEELMKQLGNKEIRPKQETNESLQNKENSNDIPRSSGFKDLRQSQPQHHRRSTEMFKARRFGNVQKSVPLTLSALNLAGDPHLILYSQRLDPPLSFVADHVTSDLDSYWSGDADGAEFNDPKTGRSKHLKRLRNRRRWTRRRNYRRVKRDADMDDIEAGSSKYTKNKVLYLF